MKMPKKVSTTNNNQEALAQAPLPNPNRCQFETSDGRRCRMPRHPAHSALCPFHARDEMQLLESQRLGAEISASINFVLGKLFTALAQNRIPPRNAAILAYIGQLMLHSLRGVKREYPFTYNYETWNNMLEKATVLSDYTPDSAPAALVPNPPNDPVLDSPGIPEK